MNELHGNVREAVRQLGTEYKIHDHSKLPSKIRNPNDFAMALGYPIWRITKTIFLCSRDVQSYAAAVCSVNRRLNFRSISNAIGVEFIETASLEDLLAKTGYDKNGVSPLGLAHDIAIVVDRVLLDYPTVLIGGGATGIEIELSPVDLIRSSGSTVENITN